jgi:hypothetical protein
MSDLTALRINDMARAGDCFVLARASLGVTSFGMQVATFPPGYTEYPEQTQPRDDDW